MNRKYSYEYNVNIFIFPYIVNLLYRKLSAYPSKAENNGNETSAVKHKIPEYVKKVKQPRVKNIEQKVKLLRNKITLAKFNNKVDLQDKDKANRRHNFLKPIKDNSFVGLAA